MSREEAEEYIDRLMKQHKINTKPLYDPRKSVSGATTDDMPFNSVWPEVIHSGQLSLEETANSMLKGQAPKAGVTYSPECVDISELPEKMKEYVQAIHENVIVPSAKSLDTLPMTVITNETMPKEEKEYIEAAVAVLDDSPPEQSEGAPEPSLSSEEKK